MYREEVKKLSEAWVFLWDLIQTIVFVVSTVNIVVAPIISKIATGNKQMQAIAQFCSVSSWKYLLSVCIVIAFYVKMIYTVCKACKETNQKVVEIFDEAHKKCIHCIRDHLCSMNKIPKWTIQRLNSDKARKDYEDDYNREFAIMADNAAKIVNQISNILNDYMGFPQKGKNSICTCIKMVSMSDSDKQTCERTVITLARSENSSAKRSRDSHKDKIGKNTDFRDLSFGYKSFFASVNLKEKYKSGEYENSTTNFKYESTVVVPIRYSHKYTHIKKHVTGSREKTTVEYCIEDSVDIVGYLCVDTEKVVSDWERYDEQEKIIAILDFYADMLYIYLSSFRDIFSLT